MSKLVAHELRNKSKEDLVALLQKERNNLRDLYFRLSGAQLKSVNEIKTTKRKISLILTLIREGDIINK